MKNSYFLRLSLFLLLISLTSHIFSQNVYTEVYPRWRLGLNAGATWQTSDVKSKAGLAGGFNIERVLNRRDDAALGFSLGFRYLSGWTYGMDTRRNSDLKNNDALNGKTDSTLNYLANPGYFYNNYKSKVADGSLELKMNFPAFEKRTHIVFHVFGGLGITKFKTRIDARDNNYQMYDYSKLNNGQQPSMSDLNSIYGSSYETYAQGSNSSGTYVFAPSLGVGLGYRFSKNVSLVFEHKVAFTFTDDLDGVRSSSNIPINGSSDIYHYTSAGLLFTLHSSARSTSTTYTTTPTNTVITQTNPNNYNTAYEPKPAITIYNPSSNPYTTQSGNLQVSGNIQHLNTAAGISISQNGVNITNFSFNPNNGALSFGTMLAPGANNFYITATNNAGSDNSSFTVNYTTPQNPINPVNPTTVVYPPVVYISSPANNYVSPSPNVTVDASASNISSAGNVAISVNGYAVSNFYFNPANGAISFPVTLNVGNNSVIVSAYNTAGSDAKTINIVYQQDAQVNTNMTNNPVLNKPVVTYFNPATCPYTAYTATFGVTAQVRNVNTSSQVMVTANGATVTNFTLNANGYVNFNMDLKPGSNTITIIGTNDAGADSKSCVIDYKVNGFPPEVIINSPTANPYNTNAANFTVDASVKNVSSQNDIKVQVNNAASNFTYNAATQKVTVPLALNMGLNSVVITATTSFGSDTKTTNVNRTAADPKPQVTIISPSPSPYNTTVNSVPVTAQVLNVNGQNQISVTNSGQAVPFNYDPSTQLVTFNAVLNTGSNTFTVKGFTKAASDSKSLTIVYTETAVTAVPNKPVVTFFNPSSCPFTAYTATFNVTAQVTNVTAANQVSVNANGNNIPNFTLGANGYVNFTMNLNQGSNAVTISGTNAGGTDVKTCVINYVVNGFPPVVTILNPSSSPYSTTNTNFTVDASVQNVNSQNEIVVTVNGGQSNFTYNAAAQKVSVPLTLNLGSTSVTITATTTFGTSTKTAVIDRANPEPKPQVTIISPTPSPYVTTTPTVPVTAQVLNVAGQSQISVTSNGQNIAFSYDAASKMVTFTPVLNNGYNTFIVKGFTKAASDSKSLTIELKKQSNGNTPPPADSIKITPYGNGGHGDVGQDPGPGGHGGNSTPPADTTHSSGNGHTNGNGDVDNSRVQVTICHTPPGGGPSQTLTIPQSALAPHLAHGDQMGACPVIHNNNGTIGQPGKGTSTETPNNGGNNGENNNNGTNNSGGNNNGNNGGHLGTPGKVFTTETPNNGNNNSGGNTNGGTINNNPNNGSFNSGKPGKSGNEGSQNNAPKGNPPVNVPPPRMNTEQPQQETPPAPQNNGNTGGRPLGPR